jgi:hypothetical protein
MSSATLATDCVPTDGAAATSTRAHRAAAQPSNVDDFASQDYGRVRRDPHDLSRFFV